MATYIKIATVTVGAGGAANMTFNSISGIYTDLLVKVSARNTVGTDHVQIAFNGSTSVYTLKAIRGNGSAAASFNGSDFGITAALESGYFSNDTSTFTNTEIYIPNYSGSNAKSVSIDAVQEANATTAYAMLNAGLWSGTSAITSIVLTGQANSFAQHSTATLYGISKS